MAEEVKKEEVSETKTEEKKEAPLDPVKQELDKQPKKQVFSDKERAAYNLRRHAEKLKELGADPLEVLGVNDDEEPKDEIPEWYRKEKAKETQATSLQLADSIQDENERNLVKSYLENRIRPSGNAEEDFRLAYAAVSSLRNQEIVKEITRKGPSPKMTAAGGSASAKVEEEFEPTPEEAYMMKNFKVSKEKIIAAREKEANRAR